MDLTFTIVLFRQIFQKCIPGECFASFFAFSPPFWPLDLLPLGSTLASSIDTTNKHPAHTNTTTPPHFCCQKARRHRHQHHDRFCWWWWWCCCRPQTVLPALAQQQFSLHCAQQQLLALSGALATPFLRSTSSQPGEIFFLGALVRRGRADRTRGF